LIQELFERAWLNCLDAERYDIEVMIDLFDSLEGGLSFNPYSMGQPHPALNAKGLWVYSSPPLGRIPKLYALYEINEGQKAVALWAARFP
jgi:hypothetical protein